MVITPLMREYLGMGYSLEEAQDLSKHELEVNVQITEELKRRPFKKKAKKREPKDISHPFAITCTDHLGNVYASKGAMVRAYGISINTYNGRIYLGWSQKEALTTPSMTKHRKRKWKLNTN